MFGPACAALIAPATDPTPAPAAEESPQQA